MPLTISARTRIFIGASRANDTGEVYTVLISSCRRFGRLDGVDQQHGAGHGADAAGDGGDPAGYLAHAGKVHVAAKFAGFVAVHADVDNQLWRGCRRS